MTLTYAEGLEFTSSEKVVFADLVFFQRRFDWTLVSGTTYDSTFPDELRMVSMTERDTRDGDAVTMQEAASLVALNALDTSTVGGWFWDLAALKLYAKPKATTSIFDNMYLAEVQYPVSIRLNESEGDAYCPVMSTAPTTTQQGSEVLDGRVARIGAGSTSLQNVENFIIAQGLEPDGRITIKRAIGVTR